MNESANRQPRIFTVAPDGGGDFRSPQEAMDALGRVPSSPAPRPVILYLKNGIYPGQLTISRPHLTLLGESAEGAVLTHGLYARMPGPDTGRLGTFRSYTCLIDADDVTVRNVTFQNSSGPGTRVGQALALYADGDRLVFENCRFLGGQDTLFTAPLPPREIEPHGFAGPKEHAPRRPGRHYYKNCYLEGDVDFVFGGAAAYFESCEFRSLDPGRQEGTRTRQAPDIPPVLGYVTAASTPRGQEYGYVMESCRFTGDCPPHTVYLGRPWREYARTVLLRCYIGAHIREEGWHDWNKPQAHDTAFFAEYLCHGPSASLEKRPGWVKRLTAAEAERYTRSRVLSGSDGWDPG